MSVLAPSSQGTPFAVYMAALGVRTGDLAERLMINRDYLSAVIHGHRRPSRRLKRAISQELSVPESTLWPEEGAQP